MVVDDQFSSVMCKYIAEEYKAFTHAVHSYFLLFQQFCQ